VIHSIHQEEAAMNIESTNLKSAASTVAQSLMKVRTYSSSTTKAPGGAATATPNGSPISSNDFLKLLVTEMKNQDPTQPTDPNAYIQQLVGVNSLQQLIAINQELHAPASSAPATPVQPTAVTSANSL